MDSFENCFAQIENRPYFYALDKYLSFIKYFFICILYNDIFIVPTRTPYKRKSSCCFDARRKEEVRKEVRKEGQKDRQEVYQKTVVEIMVNL